MATKWNAQLGIRKVKRNVIASEERCTLYLGAANGILIQTKNLIPSSNLWSTATQSLEKWSILLVFFLNCS